MFMRFGFIILFILYSSVIQLFAQAKEVDDLVAAEDSLRRYIEMIIDEDSFEKKITINNDFKVYFKRVLSLSESFGYPFDSLKNIGRLKSDDGALKVYTWNIPQARGEQKYFGFIQHRIKDSVSVFELNDSRHQIVDSQNEVFGPEKWHGALYYHIEQVKHDGKFYYTLLGADFNNLFSSKKIIELLSFTERGEPQFGAPIFNVRNQIIARVIFEYSAKASMVLNFSNDVEMIVFDHLSPSRPDLVGNFQFYGPDFTHDGFRFEDGYWFYYANVDVRNSEQEPSASQVTPPEENHEPGFLYRSNLELRAKEQVEKKD